MSKVTIWSLTALAIVALAVSVVFLAREPARPVPQVGILLDTPAAVSAFELVDHRSATYNQASLAGHWTLVFPGFTHCPDICPTTLTTLDRMQGLLGEHASGLQVVLLSVDPERDTPDVLADYLGYFNPGFVGLTGEPAELDNLYRSLGVNHIRIPGANGEYSVDHSAALMLIDPEGRLVAYFTPPFRARELAADLSLLVATSR
ncbi:SCO family protein [Kineobactrum salinum]|uniref:SCO family protein n=1 Tax=Kineobactrum salinum TaxID=2708301 RepID=A0A6C0TZP3_9GAMM|nr:SCO family protein [Kineobactrum salinum]QIB64829.1 SCO family protein [Kineobactrum salinum]